MSETKNCFGEIGSGSLDRSPGSANAVDVFIDRWQPRFRYVDSVLSLLMLLG